jgi:hypothetical protein
MTDLIQLSEKDEELLSKAVDVIWKDRRMIWAIKAGNWVASKTGGSPEVWFQRFSMIGPKWSRPVTINHKETIPGPLSYFGFMFYWFAIFWNNVHPHMWYEESKDIPWHGFTIYWVPSATGEPGAKLWKHKKEILLWR